MMFLFILVAALAVAWLLPRRLGGRSLKTAARHAMAAAFVAAGITHFAMPETMLAHFPSWTPYPELINYVTGVIEIAGGLALLSRRFKTQVGLVMAGFLVAVFPANVYVAIAGVDVPGLPDAAWYAWLRLPLQALFIWWVLSSTSAPETARYRGSFVRRRLNATVGA